MKGDEAGSRRFFRGSHRPIRFAPADRECFFEPACDCHLFLPGIGIGACRTAIARFMEQSRRWRRSLAGAASSFLEWSDGDRDYGDNQRADGVFDEREFRWRESNAGDRPRDTLPTALNRNARCRDKAEGLSYVLSLEGRRNKWKRCGIPGNTQV